MGNSFQHRQYTREHSQKTWKICMVCNGYNTLNEDLMLLNTIANIQNTRKELLLRCSKGHILLYEGRKDHIDHIREIVLKREYAQQEIDKLKQENSLLKEEIEFLKNNRQSSAPPLLNVELVEAVEIKN
jgi:hypothetical protein